MIWTIPLFTLFKHPFHSVNSLWFTINKLPFAIVHDWLIAFAEVARRRLSFGGAPDSRTRRRHVG